MAPSKKVRVVLTNDDGPPTSPEGSSPFIYPFALALEEQLGWDVRVCIPSTQRSWVGKSYLINEIIDVNYYYPSGDDGTKGETTTVPKQGTGTHPWLFLDGTPASCANLAQYSLWENAPDLIISGPNFGRNTGAAFALSSGTLGAALAGSLAETPSIAVSFGLMTGHKPATKATIDAAIKHSCTLIKQLWEIGWGKGQDQVDVYSINVPLFPSIAEPGGPKVEWTDFARTKYHRLFRPVVEETEATQDEGGPSAIPEPDTPIDDCDDNKFRLKAELQSKPLKFKFGPEMGPLINPNDASLAPGTDTHALHNGSISVTPIRAAFQTAPNPPHQLKL